MNSRTVPSEISQFLPLSSPLKTYLATDDDIIFGVISKDGLWLYFVQDTLITIYSAETGQCCGSHCFAESLKNPSARITSVVEFTSSHISYSCLLLVVDQHSKSLLCMFDIDSCTIKRAVFIPDEITTLEVVSGNGGACMDTHNMHRKLRCMFGIVAIGTRNGDLFFLDLCLEEDFDCNEQLPNITRVIGIKNFSLEKRQNAILKSQHILLHINDLDKSMQDLNIEFKSSSTIYATSMKYVASLTTLVTGFNLGCIQLWGLKSINIQYIISDPFEQPVVCFAFQEPENDPRNFCYLWAIKGHYNEHPSSTSVATLYSLTYLARQHVKNFGALYSELQSCNKRFEIPLLSDVSSSADNCSNYSRLISCQVISQKDDHHHVDLEIQNESDMVSEDTSLCFLAWQVYPQFEHLAPTYHLAVFDLNQWYQAHMPFSFRCSPNELSPYMGFFSLEDLSKTIIEDMVLGFHTVPKSVKKFKSFSTSEEFFYPSSLGFQLLCFTDRGINKKTYFGLQKHLLCKIPELGPEVLLNPKEIYPSLIKCGLTSDIHGGSERTPLTVQKETILQLAIEYHLPSFFMKCFKEWCYRDSIHEYCTSKALLSWAWKKVISIKDLIDKFCVPLFNCSGNDVDKNSLKYLYSFRKQLNLIDSIMSGYQRYVAPRSEQGIQELQCRRDAVSMVNTYLQVLLWLRSVHVLPEVCENEGYNSIVYRLERLNEFYSQRRRQLKGLHSSNSSELLIDGLVQKEVGEKWKEKGKSKVYPPPSIYAALSTYLLDGVNLQLKHSLMYYILLDVQNTNNSKTFTEELEKFPAFFGISESRREILKAFWYLDHQEGDLALKKLLHPSVHMTDISTWQHSYIIKSFLCNRMFQYALKYINHSELPENNIDDMKLHLSVLLACEAVTEAYVYQRNKQKEGCGTDLLQHLFLGCQELHKMKELISLPLNNFESKSLIKFLSESDDTRSQESLVMYHLLKCNVSAAATSNERLSSQIMKNVPAQETKVYQRSVDRNALVECLMAAIPITERCLVEEIKRLPRTTIKQGELVQPLSVRVKKNESKECVSYAHIVESLINNGVIDSSRSQTPVQQKIGVTKYENLPFIHPPVTPECLNFNRSPQNAQSGSKVIAKRLLQSSSPTGFSSPAKRARLLDSPIKSSSKRKTPKNLARDIVSLLQTPPIHRKTSVSSVSKGTPTITPQSILKKTQEKKKLQLDFHTAPTPPEVSEDEDAGDSMQVDNQNNDEENECRQIRFDLPVTNDNIHILSPYPKLITPQEAAISESSMKITSPDKALKYKDLSMLKEVSRQPIRNQEERVSFHIRTNLTDKFDTEEKSQRKDTFEEGEEISILSLPSTQNISSFLFNPEPYKLPNVPKKQSTLDLDAYVHSESMPTCDSVRSSIATPSTPIRSSTSLSDDHEKIPKAISDSAEKPDVETLLNYQNDNSLKQSPLKNESKEDSCEDFYSPCSEILDISRPTPLPPINLFPESHTFAFELPKDSSEQMVPSSIDVIQIDDDSSDVDNFGHNQKEFASSFPASEQVLKSVVTSFSDDSDVIQVDDESTDIDDSLVCLESGDVRNFQDVLKPPSKKTFAFAFSSSMPLDTSEKSEVKTTSNITSAVIESQKEICETIDTPSCLKEDVKDIQIPVLSETFLTKSTNKTFVFGNPSRGVSNPLISFSDASYSMGRKSRYTFVFGKEPTSVAQSNLNDQTDSTDLKPDVTSAITEASSASNLADSKLTPLADQNEVSFVPFEVPELDPMEYEMTSVVEGNKKDSTEQFVFSQPFVLAQPNIDSSQCQVENSEKSSCKTFVFSEPTFPKKTEASKPKFSFTFEKVKKSSEKSSDSQEMVISTKNTEVLENQPERCQHTFAFDVSKSNEKASDIDSIRRLSTKPSRRTFVFTKPCESFSSVSEKMDTCKSMASLELQGKGEEFLTKVDAGTYEEFSKSLKKNLSGDSSEQCGHKKTESNSPDSKADFSQDSLKQKNIVCGSKKKYKTKISKANPDASISSSTTKTKSKSKTKIEFSFAVPTSPADPEILAELAKSPEPNPLPSFLFSPPLTRGRLRKKQMDETMGSSFCSVMSETSFARPSTPPVDPILESIMLEKNLQAKRTPTRGRPKKGSARKSKSVSKSRMEISEKSLLYASPIKEEKETPSKKGSPTSPKNSSLRHTMVLRQAKPKPENLF